MTLTDPGEEGVVADTGDAGAGVRGERVATLAPVTPVHGLTLLSQY